MDWGTGDCPLYTLVAKHSEAGSGVPITFMIVSNNEAAPLA